MSELTEVEVDAVRQAVHRIDEAGDDDAPDPDISDLAATWQREVRALIVPLIPRATPNPRAEAWAASDRLIRAYEALGSPFYALSYIVNEFAWDHLSRQRFIKRALFVPAPPDPDTSTR